MTTTLVPYLNFAGKTAEAMKFYQSVFGGELTIQTFKQAGMSPAPQHDDRVMHAQLAGEVTFMASDTNPQNPAVTLGTNVNLSVNGDDEKRLRGYFDKLAKSGKVDMPLEKQFWGDTFGMATDKYGVHWMVNIAAAKAG